MANFDECIIHIGTEKTGTTTLQEFFYKNRTKLIQKNIFFPKTFGEKNHIKLAALACDIHKKNDIRIMFGLTNPKGIEKFRSKIYDSFTQEIRNQRCTKLLLSGEHMQSRLTSVREIEFLKKFLDNFVNKYKIIVYLRSQLEMAISLYSTLCKTGGTRKTILQDVNENNAYFSHEKLLERWSEVFGVNNIIPRIFSRNELCSGDIKKDFIGLLGLNWNDFDDVKNMNESINEEAQLFLLEINKFLPKFVDDKPNKFRGNITELVSQGRKGAGLLPTRIEAENFLKTFSNSNEQLKKKWFPEKEKLFDDDLSKYPDKLRNITDYKFAFEIFADIWSKKQEQIISLSTKKKIEKILTKLKKKFMVF